MSSLAAVSERDQSPPLIGCQVPAKNAMMNDSCQLNLNNLLGDMFWKQIIVAYICCLEEIGILFIYLLSFKW